jgi:hypothetical protein
MRTKTGALTLTILTSALLAAGVAAAADSAGEPGRSSGKKNPLNNVYFGEQHLHTQNSPDAYAMGTRNTTDDAYNFCKGKAIKKNTSGDIVQKKTPYDWFPKGQTPPVGAFWSITMYGAKKRLMVKNSINRYKIGSADKLKAAADGSTTLYIQADSPGKDKESNWLPAPKEPFYMLMRMYLPKIEVLNGQYEIPGVQYVLQRR